MHMEPFSARGDEGREAGAYDRGPVACARRSPGQPRKARHGGIPAWWRPAGRS
jgi:hypothetical protein